MSLEIVKKINNSLDKVKVTIEGPEDNLDIQKVLNILSNLETGTNELIAKKNNQIYIIKISDISIIYSKDKFNYIVSKNEEYRVDYKLYELEEILVNKFIRISNSHIVNKDYIKCFDCSIIGELIVVLKDGSKENVSKRKIKDIMKLLRNKGGKINEKI